MKTILILLLLHVLVCVGVGWLSLETKRTSESNATEVVIQRAKDAERAGMLTTEGFSLGGTTTAYSVHGAVIIYGIAGILGLFIATVLRIMELFTKG